MRQFLRDAVEAFRSAHASLKETRLWKRFRRRDTETTVEELRKRVEDGHAILLMMGSEGYRVWQAWARALIEDGKDNLCALPPAEFASAQGLQAKGFVLGAQTALNGPAQIVNRGLEAEARLAELAKKLAAAERTSSDAAKRI